MQFHGSPTVLVDGQDPFPGDAAPAGLSCRVYRTASGVSGAPTIEQLVEVLRVTASRDSRAPESDERVRGRSR